VGPTCQWGKGERGGLPLRVLPGWAWAASMPGPEWLPKALFHFYFIFFFSFSVFYFFITFAFWFQIKSNQLVKFSKIQNVNARQQGINSHNETSFQENFTNLTKMVLFA
jgi:hypothetical protein